MSSANNQQSSVALLNIAAGLCLSIGTLLWVSLRAKKSSASKQENGESAEKNKKFTSKDVVTFSDPNGKDSSGQKAFHLIGNVCKGFGRGSTQLGFPTANLDIEKLVGKSKLDESVVGVYLGWAKLNNQIYPMVCSIGWNPTYANEKKTIEAYIMHKFEKPFYGEEMELLVCGYIRPELKFNSLEELIDAINNDVAIAKELLSTDQYNSLKKALSG